MNSSNPLKHFLFAFIIALVLYLVAYKWIEHRRTRNGPWDVTFNVENGKVVLLIQQPALKIQNVRLVFEGTKAQTFSAQQLRFSDARTVPFNVPFGKCVFQDTTFLPGSVTFELFGHEIQMLPRVLTIDRKEIPWQSDTNIFLPPK